jgi:hypothetical protein
MSGVWTIHASMGDQTALEKARSELARAEQDIERLHLEILAHERERFDETDLDFRPDIVAEYEKQISARRTLIEEAEMRQARWSGDIRAEATERENERLRAKEVETERKTRTMLSITVLSLLITAAKIVYDLVK